MQSDTFSRDVFLPDTDSDDQDSDYDSDSSGDLPRNNNIGVFYKYNKSELDTKRFIDQTRVSSYEKVRSELFSKPIVKGRLLIDSSNYRTSSLFNSSNYVATFSDIKSVIGISLVKAHLRVPQYNINNTNNVIIFHKDGDINTKYTITINPGYYTVTELADAFSITNSTNSQHVEYSSGAGNFSVYYYSSNSTVDAKQKGMIFKLVHSSDNIKFEWDTNNITKGSAKLLGFYPNTSSSYQNTHYSEKPPDFSQHHVDLCIPEIPYIACKRSIFNRGEKNILDRIPLTNSTGSYEYYETDHLINNYFTPIKLDKLNIQLFSDNDEEFDSQNTDNSFEFEITVLVGRG